MKASKLKNHLLFQKTNIARLQHTHLHRIVGGANSAETSETYTTETKPTSEMNTDTISFTVITSSLKCIGLFGATTSS